MARERALWISHRQPFMRDFLHRLAYYDVQIRKLRDRERIKKRTARRGQGVVGLALDLVAFGGHVTRIDW